MATMTIPAYSNLPQQLAFAQSEVDMAMLACALERYHLAEGRYPDDLQALVPRFVAALPHDIINGQPLKYRRTDAGRFVLYSVGWNEKDDGGVVAAKSSNTNQQDVLRGDWVFKYPEKS
jgi:Tfp pilus assembly protein PilE